MPAAAQDALDALRQQCIAAARETQHREAGIAELAHRIDLMRRDAAGRQRGLDDSRAEQRHLIDTLVFLARNRPEGSSAAAFLAPPLDRLRGEAVIVAATPALRAEARALASEAEKVAALRARSAAAERDLAALRGSLEQDRERLAGLVARRQALAGGTRPGDPAAAKLAHDAKDVAELIERGDAAADRRDNKGRPAALRPFDPPQSRLATSVAGTVTSPFGSVAAAGAISRGITLSASPAAAVTAPFDGQVVYAGQFGPLGLVLIMRHGRLYHSVLAGLGRVDASIGQWVLAGEPVGAMPDSREDDAAGGGGRPLYLEFQRAGRPVDPQPWLATRDAAGPAGRAEADGERRIQR